MKLSIFGRMAPLPSLTRLAHPVFFLSDAHLGAVLIPDPQEQTKRFFNFLDLIRQNGKSLVLVGDLFDFWYEWRHVIPKRHFRILYRLRALAEAGIQIHYLAGNHDFRLKGFLEEEIGLHTHDCFFPADINGQSIYIDHGDGLLASDHGYRLLKKILRNRAAQRIFSWLHPDWGWALARGTSVTSRTLIKEDPDQDHDYLIHALKMFGEGYDGVVLGHTHRPVEHLQGEHVYVNLGDWITHYSFGLHDGTRLRLQYFGRQ